MEAVLDWLFSSKEEEQHIITSMAYFMMFMAFCSFVTLTLLKENVPYGRYASSKYGFPVNVKFAWFVQELPAILVPFLLVVSSSATKVFMMPNQLIIAMYFCHYIQRSLIYPFLIRGGKPTPFVSFALAFVFCMYNGYMQVRYLSHFAVYPASWVTHPLFLIGFLMWLFGWLINMHSDHILRNLRKPGETGYQIPKGGMFEYVSGANFLGEIIEWAGFALASQSAQSLAFSIFTTVVLTSRAFSHHNWYLEKFEDYPKNRKALIPFLL
ncbi:hypothetical protein WMY93_019485 [Mugilogobius chulae]|uniref:3-oxo-5alpha-steroid 4-dehydrogenase (NADP(+)) n=1 Tax=Mugilogobius chulae TaxID=88201 RepID=A0AAW0NP51_9GOBI